MEPLKEKLSQVIAEVLDLDPAQVVPEARFIQDLGAGSLEVMDLIVGLEEEFDVTISDAEARQIRTVQQALEFLQQRLLKTA